MTQIHPARPFVKWAGGKGQLLEQFDPYFASVFHRHPIKRYIEPFIGGGAVFFHVVQKYRPAEVVIADINPELILAYTCVQKDSPTLISVLEGMQTRYHAMPIARRRDFYYDIRSQFNENRPLIDYTQFSTTWIERTAQTIFLNHTCYNGLFRVNSKGDFNVPFGRYKNPYLFDPLNLMQVSGCLRDATILYCDFTDIERYTGPDALVYFDPPYRPLNRTANFTSYSRHIFDEKEQRRLAAFYHLLDHQGVALMLSNSDPVSQDSEDDFFEQAYRGFHIQRVTANRNINSNAGKRGPISELLITNG